jgi:hypothetical protein
MANDLPVMLDASRAHIPHAERPVDAVFLDQNAWGPEPPGMWVSGSGQADILMRTLDPVDFSR